jgi:hypothetical protein
LHGTTNCAAISYVLIGMSDAILIGRLVKGFVVAN